MFNLSKFILPGASITCIPAGCMAVFCYECAANKHHIYGIRIIFLGCGFATMTLVCSSVEQRQVWPLFGVQV
jgi:hypothetical protein